LISKIVLAVGASARITLACRGQNGVRSMNWMWRRHHQLLHLRPVKSVYAHAHPRRSLQSLYVHTPAGLWPSERAGSGVGSSISSSTAASAEIASTGGWATPAFGM